MDFLKNNTIWIICLFSFFSSLFYNQTNLHQLPEELKRDHITVITNDDASYLRPPENYIQTGIWQENSIGKQSHFVRSPGYGFFYMLFLKLVDSPQALNFLKITQLLLFACSVYWLFGIALSIIGNKKISLLIAAVYGITPFAIGFLSYTLTEGITPALVLLYIFLLVKAKQKTIPKKKIIFYFLAALTFSYLFILRPPLGVMGILIPVYLLKDYWKESFSKLIIKLALLGSISFSLMAIWQYRNYKITDKYVGFHAIYYADNNSIYRPTFREYWNFVGGWAQEGHVTHSYMVPMWQAAIKGDTSKVYIEKALATFPKKVVNHFGEDRLTRVFRKYQEATLFQKYYYKQELPMPIETSQIEMEVIEEFQELTKEYKNEFWLQYHLISPLKVFKTMAFHSNLSMFIFQHTYRGSWLMECTRFVFYGLHSFCFLALIIGLFFHKGNWQQHVITLTVFSYVFYLCYFQRGIEERYTLPILPLLMIGLGDLILKLKERLSRR